MIQVYLFSMFTKSEEQNLNIFSFGLQIMMVYFPGLNVTEHCENLNSYGCDDECVHLMVDISGL